MNLLTFLVLLFTFLFGSYITLSIIIASNKNKKNNKNNKNFYEVIYANKERESGSSLDR
jgi:hypothetical protein